MVYKKIICEDGPYKSAEGKRYELQICRRCISPEGVNVGWVYFNSLAECLVKWELQPITSLNS